MAELGDLAGALHLDPMAQIAFVDLGGRVGQIAERREHPSGDRPGQQRRHDERGGAHGRRHPHRLVDLGTLAGGESGDDEGAENLTGVAHHRHGQRAKVPLGGPVAA